MGILLEKLGATGSDTISDAVSIKVIDALIEDTSVDFFPSLLEVFEAESSQRLANIDAALLAQDTKSLGSEAHSLKGTSVTFGAEALRSVVAELERAGKAGNLAEAATLVPKIAPLHQEVIAALHFINDKLQS